MDTVIETKNTCAYCGWPVIQVCCNEAFADWVAIRSAPWDYWVYCSNKGCPMHEVGEGYFQDLPPWVRETA